MDGLIHIKTCVVFSVKIEKFLLVFRWVSLQCGSHRSKIKPQGAHRTNVGIDLSRRQSVSVSLWCKMRSSDAHNVAADPGPTNLLSRAGYNQYSFPSKAHQYEPLMSFTIANILSNVSMLYGMVVVGEVKESGSFDWANWNTCVASMGASYLR